MPTLFSPFARDAVLFQTHFWDESCERCFNLLCASLQNSHDLFVTGFLDSTSNLPIPDGIDQAFYDTASLAALPYPNLKALRPHHIAPMAFFDRYPNYSHYWMMEYDVRYTGDWLDLFESLSASRADLLATVVQRRLATPLWIHWQEFCAHQPALAEAHYIKIFTPFMRLSNAAMRAIDAAYRAGWVGHYEALWPTATAAANLTIEDIGGDSPFTPASRHLAHYTANPHDPYLAPGSFIFRPSILEQDIPSTPARLWHPVKPANMQQLRPPAVPPTWRDYRSVVFLRRWRDRLTGRRSPHF
jgi:hypothetical protein